MIKYKPRLTAADMPENDNKYYIRKVDGGYSPCIKGNPQHKHLTALSNCVGWAIGRFMEILQTQTNPLPHLNAEDFYNNAKLPKGQAPKNGAVICWRKGKLWNGNDGAGHVAIVEKVISENEIITSESAYGGMAFYTKRRKKGNGNWGASANYQFMGFIYSPEECFPEEDTNTYSPAENTNSLGNIKIGDIVQFKGGSVYVSSTAKTANATKGASRCKVTVIYNKGTHKYHLVSEDGKGVFGWVNASDVTEITKPTTSGPATTIKIGDIVQFKGGNVYVSSTAAKASVTREASRCKVTAKNSSGKHPLHLISEDGKGVYGWIDSANVTK